MIQGARNFKLVNEYGQEFDITRPGAFFHSPEGLGWGQNVTTEPLGFSFAVTDIKQTQPRPSGEMIFNNYIDYDNFLTFIQRAKRLYLAYMPLNSWYYLEVITTINKSEIKAEQNKLICPLNFKGISPWYEQLHYTTSSGESAGNGKKYAYTYSYTYGQSDRSIFDLNLNLSSYFKLEIMGEIVNPEWRVIQNGVTILSGKINATISSTHKIIVNTNPTDAEIGEYTKGGVYVQNLYNKSDFTTQRLFAIPAGDVTFAVLAQGTTAPKAFMEVLRRV